MTPVTLEVDVAFDADARTVWDELIDWKGHEAWIPATRVVLDGSDSTSAGGTFVAFTGIGKLALEDRMRVNECTWDETTESGYCEVEKLGPVLRGRAGFTVKPADQGSTVAWFEDVVVPKLPSVLSPIAARLGAIGFTIGMKQLNRKLRRSAAHSR